MGIGWRQWNIPGHFLEGLAAPWWGGVGGVECPEDQTRQVRALTREQTQTFWDGPGMGSGWAVTKNRPGSIPGAPTESAGVEKGGVLFP